MTAQTISPVTAPQAYILKHDLAHLESDVQLVKFAGWEDLRTALIRPDLFNLAIPFVFEVHSDVLESSDFIPTDVLWPILSKRMLEILFSVGPFSHGSYPVTILRNGLENHDYVVLHLLRHYDAIDWEKSVYKPATVTPGTNSVLEKSQLQKIVLKEPKYGLRPIFRISTFPEDLCVSAEGRAALEAAGIRGARFEELSSS